MRGLSGVFLVGIALLLLYIASRGGLDCVYGMFDCLKGRAPQPFGGGGGGGGRSGAG